MDKNTFIKNTFVEPTGTYIPLFVEDKIQDAIPEPEQSQARLEVKREPSTEKLGATLVVEGVTLPPPPETSEVILPPVPPSKNHLSQESPIDQSKIKQQDFIAKTFHRFGDYIPLFKTVDHQPLNDLFELTGAVTPVRSYPNTARSLRTQNNAIEHKVDLAVLLGLVKQSEQQSELYSKQVKAYRSKSFEPHNVDRQDTHEHVKEVLGELTHKENRPHVVDAAVEAAEKADDYIRAKTMKETENKKLKMMDAGKKVIKAVKMAANEVKAMKETENKKLKNDARRKIIRAVKMAADEVKGSHGRNLFSELAMDEQSSELVIDEQSSENPAVPPLLALRNLTGYHNKITTLRPTKHSRAPIRRSEGYEEPFRFVQKMAPFIQPVEESSRQQPLNRLQLKQEAIKQETDKDEMVKKVEVAKIGTLEGHRHIETLISKAMEKVNDDPVEHIIAKIRDIENQLEQTLGKMTNSQRNKLYQELKKANEELVKRQVERKRIIEEKALFMDILNRILRDPLNLQINRSNVIIEKVAGLLTMFQYISKVFIETRNHYIYLIPELVLNPFPPTQVDSYPDTLLYYLHHYHVIGVYLDALITFYDEMVKISQDIPVNQTMTVTFKEDYFKKKQPEVDAILGKMIKQVRSNLVFTPVDINSSIKDKIRGRLIQIDNETKALEGKIKRIENVLEESKRIRMYLLGKFGVQYDKDRILELFHTILKKETSIPTSSDQKEGVFRIFDIMGKVMNKTTGRLLAAGRGYSAPRPNQIEKTAGAVSSRGQSMNRPPTAPVVQQGQSIISQPTAPVEQRTSSRSARRDTMSTLRRTFSTRRLLGENKQGTSFNSLSSKTETDNPLVKGMIPETNKPVAKGTQRPLLPNPTGAPEPDKEPKVRVDTPRGTPIWGNRFKFLGNVEDSREGAQARESTSVSLNLNEPILVGVNENDFEKTQRGRMLPVGTRGQPTQQPSKRVTQSTRTDKSKQSVLTGVRGRYV